jgi:methyltransferase (TIGR00027 family)
MAEPPRHGPAWHARVPATIVSRARFVADLAAEAVAGGVAQYVILGAGLATFAERRPELASRLGVFEVDEPGPQIWKQRRLVELGFDVADSHRFVLVDFEASGSWFEQLAAAGFDSDRPTLVVSTGVTIYLTREATVATLGVLAALAPGSTLAMTFILPSDLFAAADRPAMEVTEEGARRAGTPFLSYYATEEMIEMARGAGFTSARQVSGTALAARYFAGRSDGLWPSTGEDFLLATT